MSESPDLAFVVYGEPAPGGSKTAMPVTRIDRATGLRVPVTDHNGRQKVNLVDASEKRGRPWRQKIVAAVREEIAPGGQLLEGYPWTGPIELAMVFTVKRPKVVPPEYEGYPIAKPDATKYQRAAEDALKDAGLFKDDGQVWQWRRVAKVYPGSDPLALEVPGALIYVWRSAGLQTVQRRLPVEGMLPLEGL